jgi:hypothetical protein
MADATVQKNLRDFVRAGGKLYVSDYAYAVVALPWPDFIQWSGQFDGVCSPTRFPDGCNHGPPFDAPSRSPDTDLSAWLVAADTTVTAGADGLATFKTRENWDTLGKLTAGYAGDDPNGGGAVHVMPKAWVEGSWDYLATDVPPDWDWTTRHPFTASFPYGCGRVLYTTYHTVGSTGMTHPGLLTQELVLWYLIMELQTCQELTIQ